LRGGDPVFFLFSGIIYKRKRFLFS
jgi:hypothetical protein